MCLGVFSDESTFCQIMLKLLEMTGPNTPQELALPLLDMVFGTV